MAFEFVEIEERIREKDEKELLIPNGFEAGKWRLILSEGIQRIFRPVVSDKVFFFRGDDGCSLGQFLFRNAKFEVLFRSAPNRIWTKGTDMDDTWYIIVVECDLTYYTDINIL